MSSAKNRYAARERRLAIESLESRQLLDGSALLAEGEGEVVPDFRLRDVNAASTSYNQQVSPRDYLNRVSAWYFIHTT
jgi:hypothetical protein